MYAGLLSLLSVIQQFRDVVLDTSRFRPHHTLCHAAYGAVNNVFVSVHRKGTLCGTSIFRVELELGLRATGHR